MPWLFFQSGRQTGPRPQETLLLSCYVCTIFLFPFQSADAELRRSPRTQVRRAPKRGGGHRPEEGPQGRAGLPTGRCPGPGLPPAPRASTEDTPGRTPCPGPVSPSRPGPPSTALGEREEGRGEGRAAGERWAAPPLPRARGPPSPPPLGSGRNRRPPHASGGAAPPLAAPPSPAGAGAAPAAGRGGRGQRGGAVSRYCPSPPAPRGRRGGGRAPPAAAGQSRPRAGRRRWSWVWGGWLPFPCPGGHRPVGRFLSHTHTHTHHPL